MTHHLRRRMERLARRIWSLFVKLDRADPSLLRFVPGKWKRHVGRAGRSLLDRTVSDDVEISGLSLTVPAELRRLYSLDDYEALTRKILDICLLPGMVAVDGGANIGLLTLQMSRRVGPEGHVYAVEPDPRNREFLIRNLERHRAENVTVLPMALGAERSTRTFHLSGAGSSLYPLEKPATSVAVDQMPLDHLLDSDRVDLIKLDVEGAEVDALAGMSEILLRNPGVLLLVEWSPATQVRAGRQAVELPDTLLGLGFEVRLYDEDRSMERRLEDVLEEHSRRPVSSRWYANLLASRTGFPKGVDGIV